MDARFHFHFSRSMSPAEVLAKAQQLYATLTQIPEIHEPLPPLQSILEEMKAAMDALQEAASATAAGDKRKIPDRDDALEKVLSHLNRAGAHVQLAAWNKAHLLPKTGFEMVRPRATSAVSLSAPANFKVKNTDEPGGAYSTATPQRGAFGYEIYITTGDPTVEENWKYLSVYKSTRRMEITGLEQGKKYSFRIRALGKNNTRGPWSPSVTLIIT